MVEAAQVLHDDLLRLRPNLTLDLVEDIPAQSQELFPVARPGLDRFPEGFRHGLFRVADRLGRQPLHVVQGVLQKCPGTLVLDLLRLRLHLGPGQPDVVDRIGPGQGDDGQDDVGECGARRAGDNLHVHVFCLLKCKK